MKEELKKMIDRLNCIDDRKEIRILYSLLKIYLAGKEKMWIKKFYNFKNIYN